MVDNRRAIVKSTQLKVVTGHCLVGTEYSIFFYDIQITQVFNVVND